MFTKSTKNLPTIQIFSSAKRLLFTKCSVVNKDLIDDNLSKMTQMSSSNSFGHEINHSQVVIFFQDQKKSNFVSEI